MATDVLAPCVARLSATMELNIYNKNWAQVFQKEELLLALPSQNQEMTENPNI